MDLALFFRVLWRFRLIVAAGAMFAAALALLSLVRVGSDGIQYRESELWASTSRLLVTQKGFPWGRAVADEAEIEEQAKRLGIRFADPNRFISLAVLYAQFATSDPVRRIMLRDGPVRGKINAAPVVLQNVGLPLVDVEAVTTDPQQALLLGRRATAALDTYLRQLQDANAVPAADRVVVQVLSAGKRPRLFAPRSKTMPIVIFLTVLIATCGLAFVLENLRPRVRPLAEPADPLRTATSRRGA